MAVSTEQLLILLRRAYTITTFYRLSTKSVFQSSVRIPEGYLLISPKGEEVKWSTNIGHTIRLFVKQSL